MRRIKGRSASKIFESFPDLKKRYWGRHFCPREYFCVTSGELTEEMIKNYLEQHFEPKGDVNFKTEPYPDFSPLYEPTSFSWWLFSFILPVILYQVYKSWQLSSKKLQQSALIEKLK